jgi:hypothetical protein
MLQIIAADPMPQGTAPFCRNRINCYFCIRCIRKINTVYFLRKTYILNNDERIPWLEDHGPAADELERGDENIPKMLNICLYTDSNEQKIFNR